VSEVFAPSPGRGAQRDGGRTPLEERTMSIATHEEHGITVVPVVGSELGRDGGGPRCMTCPISRDG
jgi:arginine deiminase